MISRRTAICLTAIGLSMTASIGSALAVDYPTRPVKWVVGYPPGGATDIIARLLGQRLSERLGQQFVIENKPGAGNNIATESVINAEPDGYTVLLVNPANYINATLYTNLKFNLVRDIAPVAAFNRVPNVMTVNNDVPAKTVAEFIAWVKANPGKVSYASFSPGTLSHFLGHQFNERFGLDMPHITFKGSGPQVQSLIGGHVPLGFSQIQTGLPHVQAGRLNALAVTGATRWRQLPAVPTFTELGYADFTAATWFGLVANSATPPDVLAKLIDAAKAAHAAPAVRARLEQMGFDVVAQTGAEFAAATRAGQERWARVVKVTGFRAAN
jgi:tripartite-type tricarboxylate transporter receptor subunit TctC